MTQSLRMTILWMMLKMNSALRLLLIMHAVSKRKINSSSGRNNSLTWIGPRNLSNSRHCRQLQVERMLLPKQKRQFQRKLNLHQIITNQTTWDNWDAILEKTLLIPLILHILKTVSLPNKTLTDFLLSSQCSKETSKSVVRSRYTISNGILVPERNLKHWRHMRDIHQTKASMMIQSWVS